MTYKHFTALGTILDGCIEIVSLVDMFNKQLDETKIVFDETSSDLEDATKAVRSIEKATSDLAKIASMLVQKELKIN